jgi:hypothetical protein
LGVDGAARFEARVLSDRRGWRAAAGAGLGEKRRAQVGPERAHVFSPAIGFELGPAWDPARIAFTGLILTG